MLRSRPRFLIPRSRRSRIGVASVLIPLLSLASAGAKDAPISGVLVFKSGNSLAEVQVTGFLINGKTELRECSGTGSFDKSGYKSMTKLSLSTVKTLERLPDGTISAEAGAAVIKCVVPGNYKFERDGAVTPAELIDRSSYSGQVLGSMPAGITSLPPFSLGSKFFIGNSTDSELAEYLLAQRTDSIPSWRTYLDRHPAGRNADLAKSRLVELLVQDGSLKLASYVRSAVTPVPAYRDLMDAHDRDFQALDLMNSDDGANRLRKDVIEQLKDLCNKAAAKLEGFRQAMATHSHGYDLLMGAKNLSDRVTAIDSKYPQGVALRASVATETSSIDTAVQTAIGQRASAHFDDAYASISKYVFFSEEESRVGEIVRDAYRYHLDNGKNAVNLGDWQRAVTELRRAREIEQNDEVASALAKAEEGLLAVRNKAAADKALSSSRDFGAARDFIDAYEVLATLTDAQRLLVTENMTALREPYVQSAIQRAMELLAAHTPIQGRKDEDAIREAYDYLQKASKLSDNPELAIKLDLMGETISSYYVELGKKYLSKPLSSGVGVGWTYLSEALQYRRNLDIVHDEMTRNNAAYQMRSKLSINVLFRDQTSRRDSAGFADQLQEALATGLETSGLPVRVILPSNSSSLEPNFRFVGEILQHRSIRNPKKETLQSEYRSGSREIPNQEWNDADQQYEAANLDLEKAQAELTAAAQKNRKKQVDEANKKIAAIQGTILEKRAKMNSIPRNKIQDVVSPYNYTRTTLELTNIVELSFRILDSSGNVVGQPINIVKGEKPKEFIILDNIKPDDTRGLKDIDALPDEMQLLNDVEIQARDSMVAAARERVQALPQKILTEAHERAANGDLDGAGESYVLYLNCTSPTPTKERAEATHFLSETFNLRHAIDLGAIAQ